MTVIVNSRSPLISLAISENWLGHLEFPEFPSQRKQGIAGEVSSGNFAQAVTERQEGVERNQALLIQNRSDSVGDQLMHTLGIRSRLGRTGQQIDECFLKNRIRFAACREQQFLQGGAAGVEKLC